MAAEQIASIDLANFRDKVERNKFVDILGKSLEHTGLVFIKTEEITPLLPLAYQTWAQFFALPEEVKLTYERAEMHHQRGYTPSGTETGIQCSQPNQAENFFIGPELPRDHPLVKSYPIAYPPNIYPTEVAQIHQATENLYQGLAGLGLKCLEAIEIYLGKTPGYFTEMTTDAPTLIRPLNYPALTQEQVGKVVWACTHTDINLVTLLPKATKKGLEIKTRSGQWISGMAPKGYSILQVGDMLQHDTQGAFLSAEHKVVAPDHPTPSGRQSFALFVHARPDALLGHEGNELYPRRTADELLQKRLQEIKLAKTETS